MVSSDLRLQNVSRRFQTAAGSLLSSWLWALCVCVRACVCRHSRGGWRRRLAAEVRGWVLVVPSHVEPHAAASLPQRVLAARADGPQQGICPGEIPAETSACKKRARAALAALGAVFSILPLVLRGSFLISLLSMIAFSSRTLLVVIVISLSLHIKDLCRSWLTCLLGWGRGKHTLNDAQGTCLRANYCWEECNTQSAVSFCLSLCSSVWLALHSSNVA